MADVYGLTKEALQTIRRLVREEAAKFRNPIPLRKRWTGGRGGGGTTTTTSSGETCGCGTCLDAGSISACSAIGDAPLNFKFSLTGTAMTGAFGQTVVLTHVSSCTWESDEFASVDLGDGNHDYTWRLVFTGDGVEEATLTLVDET